MVKDIFLDIKKADIITDDGFLFSNINSITSFLLGESDTDYSAKTSDIDYLLTLSLFSSSYNTKILRTYENVAELFANISGILNFLIFIGFIVSRFETTIEFHHIYQKIYFFIAIQEK